MKKQSFKYFVVFSLPVTVWLSFNGNGWLTFLPLLYVFGLVPLSELFTKPDSSNLSEEEEQKLKSEPFFDWVLYLIIPVQYAFLFYFLSVMQDSSLSVFEQIGKVSAFGLMCGIFGINVAHELGHRGKKYEQLLAKALLLTSLYMHFFIEHNRGHHKHVATENDPASARYGESVYGFWIRSLFNSYLSAWRLGAKSLKRKGYPGISLHNEMLVFQIIQLTLVATIAFFFGVKVMVFFVTAAIIGIILLETVNYIEHYGLSRKKVDEGHYERVMPMHSWNSDHVIGRLMLFELSRHSDHHYLASRKYQILRHHDDSPQMPTGYPGMMLLALLPPLWFYVMNPKVKNVKELAI